MTERDIKQYYLGVIAGICRGKFIQQIDNNGNLGEFVFVDGEELTLEEARKKIRAERDSNLVARKDEQD